MVESHSALRYIDGGSQRHGLVPHTVTNIAEPVEPQARCCT
jgi:hypothetical protein